MVDSLWRCGTRALGGGGTDQGECEGRMRVRIPVIELLLPLKTSFVEGMIEVEIIRTEVSGPE